MENTLQKTTDFPLVPTNMTHGAMQSALAGDLSRLPEPDRLTFYGALCQFTGLNPLSKPFDWITFQGKLTLYANKGCAEQLRKIHGVSVDIIERKVEFGCLIVHAKATDKDGRHDESIAAVAWGDRMTGEAAAIAMMKCETKAKRRVTLSICGLSMFVDREDVEAKAEAASVIPDSVDDRLEKLNSQLTAGEKEKSIDAEIVNQDLHTRPVSSGGQPLVLTPEPAGTPPRESISAEAPQQAPPPPAEPVIPAQPAASDLLTDAEVSMIEAVFAQLPDMKRAVDYCIYRGWMQKGSSLNTISRANFTMVTAAKNLAAFKRYVEAWKGTL